jgi:hypothetical protein
MLLLSALGVGIGAATIDPLTDENRGAADVSQPGLRSAIGQSVSSQW